MRRARSMKAAAQQACGASRSCKTPAAAGVDERAGVIPFAHSQLYDARRLVPPSGVWVKCNRRSPPPRADSSADSSRPPSRSPSPTKVRVARTGDRRCACVSPATRHHAAARLDATCSRLRCMITTRDVQAPGNVKRLDASLTERVISASAPCVADAIQVCVRMRVACACQGSLLRRSCYQSSCSQHVPRSSTGC